MKKRLPIGIQTFSKIREDNYYYVDKTSYIYRLANEGGGYYFLSRPRRFGKSLFVDTLKEAFSGNKQLFKGLYLENNWDWSKQYPVIHIDFGSGNFNTSKGLLNKINNILKRTERLYDIIINEKHYSEKFLMIIEELYNKFNEKVVVLIDEYDKPILDKIENKKIADENREVLRSFYSVLKSSDSYLKFVFITGVTKFNKVSIFSGLNQLEDITLDKRYSAICGYTDEDIDTIFAEELEGLDREEIRKWYNGYNWLGESVYNPFDILVLFSKRMFSPYWFATGTPTYLLKLIKENHYYLPEIQHLKITESILDSFDIENISIENLLFQAGYLTIKEINKIFHNNVYKLTYPNLEVQISLNDHLLSYLSNIDSTRDVTIKEQLVDVILNNTIEKLDETLKSFYASIPYEWFINNQLDKYEGYYASVLYALVAGTGLEVKVEDSTNKGKLDMMIGYEGKNYIIEFKVIKNENEKGSALQQIKEKKYAEKYKSNSKELYLVGIEFSEQERNVVNVEYEKIK